MASTIFYAWQANLPNATNRGMIQGALENAARAIRNDGSIEVEPVVDRDTSGEPGSPDIAAAIYAKIEVCDVFVGDVSIVGTIPLVGPMPNPNVLFELAYAVRARGWGRVVMVMNTVYGNPEQLPFDLRGRRVLTYEAPEEDAERAPTRRVLEAKVRDACATIFREVPSDERVAPTPTGASLAASKLIEAELDTYAELWSKLTAVHQVARSVRPVMDPRWTPKTGQ